MILKQPTQKYTPNDEFFSRIMFGSNQLYVLHHPQDAAIQEKEGTVVEKVSFDSAQEEIAKNKGFDMDKSGKSKGLFKILIEQP